MKKLNYIVNELGYHLPYTIFSVSFGLIVIGLLNFSSILINSNSFSQASELLFHIFHPLHILFSAAATTAMFWRYEKKLIKSILIGFAGSIIICSISDIAIPFLSGIILGAKMQLHIDAIEHPFIIIPFLTAGIFAGLVLPAKRKSTIFSHSAHVLISSMASILYLISFGLENWINLVGIIFIFMILAVIIPCCTSDIVFPLLFAKKSNE